MAWGKRWEMDRILRLGMIELALLATVSAMAQQAPVLDGKAALTGPVADCLSYSAPVPTRESVRSLIISYLNKPASMPQTPEEKDFFAELASGAAVEVTLPGKTVNLPPLSPEPLKIVKLLVAPPNLNTLWKQPGEPTLVLVEVSRWGDRGRNRVTGYMANMLYGAWSRSTVRTAYRDWASEYAGISNAISTIEDPAVKKEATLLLKSAVEQVFTKCKADGREPMPLFLYDLPLQSVGVPRPN